MSEVQASIMFNELHVILGITALFFYLNAYTCWHDMVSCKHDTRHSYKAVVHANEFRLLMDYLQITEYMCYFKLLFTYTYGTFKLPTPIFKLILKAATEEKMLSRVQNIATTSDVKVSNRNRLQD